MKNTTFGIYVVAVIAFLLGVMVGHIPAPKNQHVHQWGKYGEMVRPTIDLDFQLRTCTTCGQAQRKIVW